MIPESLGGLVGPKSLLSRAHVDSSLEGGAACVGEVSALLTGAALLLLPLALLPSPPRSHPGCQPPQTVPPTHMPISVSGLSPSPHNLGER